jgi:hypothetical protein
MEERDEQAKTHSKSQIHIETIGKNQILMVENNKTIEIKKLGEEAGKDEKGELRKRGGEAVKRWERGRGTRTKQEIKGAFTS